MMNLYVRIQYGLSSLSNGSAALIGAGIGGLMIYLGRNFRVGSFFLSGPSAYVPAIIFGAISAVLIRYLLRRE